MIIIIVVFSSTNFMTADLNALLLTLTDVKPHVEREGYPQSRFCNASPQHTR